MGSLHPGSNCSMPHQHPYEKFYRVDFEIIMSNFEQCPKTIGSESLSVCQWIGYLANGYKFGSSKVATSVRVCTSLPMWLLSIGPRAMYLCTCDSNEISERRSTSCRVKHRPEQFLLQLRSEVPMGFKPAICK